MKKLATLIIGALVVISCTGDQGPRGPEGPQGPPGEAIVGTVFEVQGDFTPDNEFSLFVEYADFTDVEVFESDVVLVYLRTGQDGEADGEPVFVWRQLPQTYYIEGGTMQYNFDYTFFDVNIFLESNQALSGLGSGFTDDQVFRIAIMPADFASSVDTSNYYEVMSALKVRDRDIPKLELE